VSESRDRRMPTAWLHCIGVCRRSDTRPASAIVGRCKPCSYGAHSPLRRMPSCWRLRWDMHNERVRKCAQCACACACACVRVRRVPFPVGQTDRWALRCLCLFRCGGGLHSPTVRAPAVSALSHSRMHACGYTHARTHASTLATIPTLAHAALFARAEMWRYPAAAAYLVRRSESSSACAARCRKSVGCPAAGPRRRSMSAAYGPPRVAVARQLGSAAFGLTHRRHHCVTLIPSRAAGIGFAGCAAHAVTRWRTQSWRSKRGCRCAATSTGAL
jgi:hypothetical protein